MITLFWILEMILIPTSVFPDPQGKTIIPDRARWEMNILLTALS